MTTTADATRNATAAAASSPRTPSLAWSDALSLAYPDMDDTHEAFVALLGRAETAAPSDRLAAWETLIAHTDEHFAREDAWMLQTGYAAGNCHAVQHQVVLQVMREVAEQAARTGDAGLIPAVAAELGRWFIQHAQSMDAGLAMHLRSVGFDAGSGAVTCPQAVPAQAITGCGSAACGPGH
jgi:hemerythrin-like metal-binding protein